MAQGRSTKIISTIKWIRTSGLSINKSLSVRDLKVKLIAELELIALVKLIALTQLIAHADLIIALDQQQQVIQI